MPELAALGVARVSLGASVAMTAYAAVNRCAAEALTSGTYEAFAEGLDHGSLNALMTR